MRTLSYQLLPNPTQGERIFSVSHGENSEEVVVSPVQILVNTNDYQYISEHTVLLDFFVFSSSF